MNSETTIKIRLLQDARQRIKERSASRGRLGICEALQRAATALGGPAPLRAQEDLRRHIREALEGCVYLEGWMMCSGHWLTAQRPGAAKQARLDWIDWMIKCLREDNP